MKIDWVSPFDNYDSITRYEIDIKNKAGLWQQDTVTCDGALLQIRTNTECFNPLLTLIQDFNLIQGDPVIARVAATNHIGTSNYIQVIGVLVETAPSQPFGLANGSGTTNS